MYPAYGANQDYASVIRKFDVNGDGNITGLFFFSFFLVDQGWIFSTISSFFVNLKKNLKNLAFNMGIYYELSYLDLNSN